MTAAAEQPVTTLQHLPLGQVHPHPRNVRMDVGDIAELAASITAKGLLQPLLVAPALGEQAGWVLIAGHRRHAAAQLAKLATLPCVVREDLDTPQAQLEAMLVENLQRTDLTPVEEGDAYQALLDFDGYTLKRITKATGRAPRTVRDRLAIAHLPTAVRDRVARGQITLEQSLAVAGFDKDPEAQDRLVKAVGTQNWAWTLQREQERRARAQAESKARRDAAKAGVAVLEVDTDLDYRRVSSLPGVKPEAHGACPGHALLIGGWDSIAAVCTQPELHEVQQADVDPELAEEVRRARAERDRVRADLGTAAAVRRGYLADVLASGDERFARQLFASVMAQKATLPWRLAYSRAYLRLPEEAAAADVEVTVAGLNLAQLVIFDDLLEYIHAENGLASDPGTWPASDASGDSYQVRGTDAWRARLVDVYGHDWSEVELQHLQKPAAGDEAEQDDVDDEDAA